MFWRADSGFHVRRTRDFYEGKEVWSMSLRTG
jgi:hypothetical protein